ncbi:hypothetical protein MOQ_000673 [Trypanosoma cruzi marinkellei]|uniref:Uncharacterized protein n=1 Tax=Trypanosoma cruzi marinkellei TaxID=85056 RepID=K2NIC6_TRYCR|nr:hypothetical protein MOQ_000673 [Trypanosoma cruzi marinkellei]
MQEEFLFSVSQIRRDIDMDSTISKESCSSSNASSRSTSVASSGRRSGSRRVRRGVLSENESKRRPTSRKNYADHVPMFRNPRRPTTILLEPFPNRRLRSMCIAGGLLVTAHRNGIRVYRQRFLTASNMASARSCGGTCDGENNYRGGNNSPDIRTGMWEVVESRDSFQLQDAYLCVGAEPVFSRERVLPLKWNRYLAVACGSDRTRFSICVLSTAAHFLLHHELHAKNRVVALHFSLVAMDAKPGSRHYQPFVVSVDEVGEVVIFDVEHDHAVKLTAPTTTPASASLPINETLTDDRNDEESPDVISCEENSNRNDNKSNKHNTSDDAPFFSSNKNNGTSTSREKVIAGDCGGKDNGTGSVMRAYRLDAGMATNVCLLGPCQVYCRQCCDVPIEHGTLVMSIYISSRAYGAEGQAEMHVSHFRFRWCFSPPRAIVLSETPILREGAPEDVCDIGVAMLRVPFHEELPQSFTIGRPRLRFWSLSGCTGKLLHLHRVYHDKDGSGKGARTVKEHFLRVVPLGRHILLQDINTSWLCIAALTDDDVILLLGMEPQPARRKTPTRAQEPSRAGAAEVVDGRDALEKWLEDVDDKKEKSPSPRRPQLKPSEDVNTDAVPLPRASSPLKFMDPDQDYTVLMMLTAPGTLGATTNSSSDRCVPFTRILLYVPQSNELLFYMGGSDDIYSICLPFLRTVTSVEGVEKATAKVTVQKPQKTSTVPSNSWMGAALSASELIDMKIARPLISAMWSLAGEVEVDEASLPPLTSSSASAPPPPPPPPPLTQVQSPTSMRIAEEGGRANSISRNVVEVHIDDDRSKTPRKKKRRNDLRPIMNEDGRIIDSEGDMRRAYMKEERRKLLNSQHWSGMKADGKEGEGCTEDAGILKRLISMEEPLQRNAIVYEWSDIHDDLYVQFTQKSLEVMEQKKCDVTHDTSELREMCYGSFRDCVILSEFTYGDHSAGFMQAFRHAQQRRQKNRDQGRVFDFAAYFSSGVVPQRLLDLQEDDRCHFELEDLRAAFEDDIKNFNEVDTVLVYENQEREVDSNGRRRWVPHPTFPFDDKDGVVIDIVALNNTAAIRNALPPKNTTSGEAAWQSSASSVGWRWASEAEESRSPRTGGSKLVRRELQSWNVGDWVYATRWPRREEEAQGTFQWSTSDDTGVAKVRRRQLTRNRINVALERAKDERKEEYMRKLEELRMELNL